MQNAMQTMCRLNLPKATVCDWQMSQLDANTRSQLITDDPPGRAFLLHERKEGARC